MRGLAAGAVAFGLVSCVLFDRAAPAATAAEYKAALDSCRAEGKRKLSYAVYESCAKDADAKFGLDGGAP